MDRYRGGKPSFSHKEDGAVLLFSLMILIAITMVTLTASQSSILEQKMSSNSRDDMIAFQVAEAAIIEAEKSVHLYEYTFDGGNFGTFDGVCDVDEDDCYISDLGDFYNESTWNNSITTEMSLSCGNNKPDCRINGQYIIVRLGEIDLSLSNADAVKTISNQYQDQSEGAIGLVYKYKIIGRGKGNNPENVRVIVSYFAAVEQG